ncbi:Sec-independent protein translocase protein TatC [Actinomadura rubrobrunea]|uniref:Sec-independent protein translocase protein TatC n=1 Tax=Actinomadura rubrobrunea TaxID=115335 RepID=A0A9W6PXS2_9ACTN|nr:twin-arginine translocase subunit TatC [Actinomadura rubrobrunea]GLW64933.1 Sec-independent protein translocase protein TatC [Actinomadura rubrobrunea]
MKFLSPRGKAVDPEGRMPLMDHLRELRNRLIKSLLALLVGTIVGWIFFQPIWDFLKDPYCSLPASQQLEAGKCTLVVNTIFQQFFLRLKISFIIGIVLSSPVWLYQLWAFVAPGLYRREKRWTYVFLSAAIPLFIVGTVLAYLTVDKGLQLFLGGFSIDDVTALITVDHYLGYVLAMLLVFGMTFELPLFVVILNLAGVLSFERIKKTQRIAIFGIFLFAAVATPSGDPFTMLALAVPTLLLFEVSAVLAFFNDRRRARRPDPYAGLSDDEPSPLDLDEIDAELERGGRPADPAR